MMMKLLKQIFSKSSEQQETEFRNNLEAFLHAYGEVLERNETISDVKGLPASKEMTKKILLEAIKLCPLGDRRELLRGGYVALAYFQPMSAAECDAIQKWNGLAAKIKENPGISNSVMVEFFDVWSVFKRFMNTALAEADVLSSELKAAGY